MTTDTHFAKQVEEDAVKMGWPRDLAKLLARMTGKPGPRPASARAVKGKAPPQRVSLDRMVALCELPAAVASEFRAAGIASVEAATPLLRDYTRHAARGAPAAAAAAVALRLHLIGRKVYNRKDPK